jgi:DNA polymerase III delta subunit
MLFVFHGADTNMVADKTNHLVSKLVQKRPGANVFTFEGADHEVARIDELVEAQGLFVEKHIVVFRRPFENKEGEDMMLSRLERFALSENIFIIEEGVIQARHRKEFEHHAHTIEEHKGKQANRQVFNVFALSDAMGMRDRKRLWTLYMEARRAGVEPESILGTLHWAVRGMLVAGKCDRAEEAGQKEFAFSKAKRFSRGFSRTELVTMSHALLSMYHDAHRGKGTLDADLEHFTLTLRGTRRS